MELSESDMVKNEDTVMKYVDHEGSHKIDELSQELEQWKDIKVKIAVIGQSGAGKSSFINKFRGLTPKDRGKLDSEGMALYAEVGLEETTLDIKSYRFLDNPLIELFDLPGAGTKNFPVKTYSTVVKIEQYDAFVLLAKDRFHENDIRISEGIRKLSKPLFFARTHADVDAQKFASDKGDRLDKESWEPEWSQELKRIGGKCKELLARDINIYFIAKVDHQKINLENGDHFEIALTDFQKLKTRIIDSLPALQKISLLFTMGVDSNEMIEMKVEQLRSRIWKVALMAAGMGALPLLGFSLQNKKKEVCAKEIAFQMEQLGIDSTSLEKKAGILKMIKSDLVGNLVNGTVKSSDNEWVKSLYLKSSSKESSLQLIEKKKDVQALALVNESNMFSAEMVTTSFVSCIPIIGAIVGAAVNGTQTSMLLHKGLDMNEVMAKKCSEVLLEDQLHG